ncbi:hypothetical protein [Carnobacterium pleistocenium]|uniref:hypothetical protein n=1 Tax=Carnobacterium pleistocenium TaxID=181073 RepID=UPI0005560A7A|nr:hypothetical protein [Carnobacterium pleistocenium]
MDNEKLPALPMIDFPDYNEDTQNYLWPVIVKYYGKPAIEFSCSKSEIIKAFHLLDTLNENDSVKAITIDNRTFGLKNLDSMQFEGRTYDFA